MGEMRCDVRRRRGQGAGKRSASSSWCSRACRLSLRHRPAEWIAHVGAGRIHQRALHVRLHVRRLPVADARYRLHFPPGRRRSDHHRHRTASLDRGRQRHDPAFRIRVRARGVHADQARAHDRHGYRHRGRRRAGLGAGGGRRDRIRSVTIGFVVGVVVDVSVEFDDGHRADFTYNLATQELVPVTTVAVIGSRRRVLRLGVSRTVVGLSVVQRTGLFGN